MIFFKDMVQAGPLHDKWEPKEEKEITKSYILLWGCCKDDLSDINFCRDCPLEHKLEKCEEARRLQMVKLKYFKVEIIP